MRSDPRGLMAIVRAIQDDINAVWLPPPESAAARSNAVIPPVLVKGTRKYIELVAHQVNSTYEHASYDACAVMLRRLIETLIIESFEAHGVSEHIKKPTGDFMYLGELIDKTLVESSWNLSRNCKQALRRLKDVGDKSAHSRFFNAIREDIDKLKDDVRTVVQELVYHAKHK